MLDKFRKAKQAELDMLAKMQSEGRNFTPYAGERASFADAIRRDESGLKVIAEYKRASPSKVISTLVERNGCCQDVRCRRCFGYLRAHRRGILQGQSQLLDELNLADCRCAQGLPYRSDAD